MKMNDDARSSLRTSKRIATLLDAEFGVGKFRIGLDPLIGVLPVAGDTLALTLSSYIVLTAFKFNAPVGVKFRMVFNLMLDYLVGSIPILGDIFDVAYKANVRNIKLLENHLYERVN